ncbi:MAG: serine/threonine protein kinase [Polyangiaceae bacterium]|nr:serine/threonine protein kinase [Polyangiaceae bacterium]
MSVAPDNEFTIPPGTIVLDKYRVAESLGIGGMGLVVKAIHTTLETPVAIKFLLPQYTASQEASRRFIREAQAASKIASEHIVRVFDTGSSHPYGPYIVMEFLKGHDLSKHLRSSGPLPLEVAIDFIVQSCHALAEAHAQGIVHRDVKPANLFMVQGSDGPTIKVLDFGISKVIEQTSLEVTKTTAILGSGLYMSPEQMKSSKTVDHRTDVYALGVTLFELLTKTQPFTADSFAELAIKVNMEAPTDLRSLRPDISEELAKVIGLAYAKKADDRYQTVGELAAALVPWASPRTAHRIEALAKREMRRSIGSLPKHLHLSSNPPPIGATTAKQDRPSYPAAVLDSELKIPRPPSLPSASSMGMETFGVSGKKSGRDALTQTGEQSFESEQRRSKSGVGGLVGIGIAVGAVLALGTAGVIFLRSKESGAETPAARLTASANASGSAVAATTATVTSPPTVGVLDAPSSSSPAASASSASAKVGPSAALVATSGPSKSATPSATSTSEPPKTATAEPTAPPTAPPTATATVPPVPIETAAPCKMRDVEGNLIDCPK